MNKKTKHKWSKQIGYFSLKKPLYKDTTVHIDVFYKDELIGYILIPYRLNCKSTHRFDIFNFDTSPLSKMIIGDIQFYGIKHKLPKQIIDIRLFNKSILTTEREVIFEKHKIVELGLVMAPPAYSRQ